MTRMRAIARNVVSVLVGMLIGALLVLGVDGLTRPSPRPTESPSNDEVAETVTPATPAPRDEPLLLLAWSPQGLPGNIDVSIESMPAVSAATVVHAGLDWIESSRADDGTIVDDPPRDHMIPFEMAVVDPHGYSAFVPQGDAGQIFALRRGEILLSRTSAQLRGAAEGLHIEFPDREERVGGIISDIAASGYEAIAAHKVPETWEKVFPFLLVQVRPDAREIVEERIRSMLPADRRIRFRARGETPFLRYGDAVLPQMLIKEVFGEFAARPRPDGGIDVETAWRQKNIHTAAVPLLGNVTCHRSLFPQLRGAMQDLIDSGLGHTLDPEQFGGCYGPRFIGAEPGGRLSHHSWGIALDFNVSENPFGAEPRLDSRVVEKLEEDWGFTWGGRWLIPDGMHFEWVEFP